MVETAQLFDEFMKLRAKDVYLRDNVVSLGDRYKDDITYDVTFFKNGYHQVTARKTGNSMMICKTKDFNAILEISSILLASGMFK